MTEAEILRDEIRIKNRVILAYGLTVILLTAAVFRALPYLGT